MALGDLGIQGLGKFGSSSRLRGYGVACDPE